MIQRRKKFAAIAFAMAICLAISGTTSAIAAPAAVATAKTDSKARLSNNVMGSVSVTLYVGEKSGFGFQFTEQNGKWKSSNKKVASVSAYGLVTAKKAGKAKITCTFDNGMIFVINVTVKDNGTNVFPSGQNVKAVVEGSFDYVDKDVILKNLNKIRKEACQNGYRNPRTGDPLTMEEYVPLKWSSDLERIAQIRAVEYSIYHDHWRPNGKYFSSLTHNGTHSESECLGVTYSGILGGIDGWYAEKRNWLNPNSDNVSGHYTNLIDPTYKYVGLAAFKKSGDKAYSASYEVGYESTDSGEKSNLKGKTKQEIEVQDSIITKAEIQLPSSIKIGGKRPLSVTARIRTTGSPDIITDATVTKNIKWTSSDKSVLEIQKNGTVKAKKAGKAVISAQITKSIKAKKTITVITGSSR